MSADSPGTSVAPQEGRKQPATPVSSSPPSNHVAPARQVPLDRTTIERVLARAAELQVSSAEAADAGALTESQLIEIAAEVGISRTAITQALAEERSRISVPGEDGLVASITGPSVASASRVVHGTPAEVMASLDKWMQREECLQVQRRFPDRITWEARKGFIGSLQRGLNVSGRGYHLCRADQVAATVVPVDDTSVLVRLDADISESRSARLRTSGGALVTGAVGGGAIAVVGLAANAITAVLLPVVAVPLLIGAAAAYGVAKRHRQIVMKAQLALEQTLDQIEMQARPRLK